MATSLGTARWSSARDCPRKAVYEAAGAPARDRSDREQRILFRGKRLGSDYADWIAARYGEDAIEREKPVVWGGRHIGHIDIFMRETRTPIEILSSASPESQIDSKAVQLAGYMTFLGDECGPVGLLVLLNPVDFSEERITIRLTDDLRAEVQQRVAAVLSALDGGDLPARVCQKPSDAIGHFCVFAEHCFTGWQPPDVPIVDDPGVRDLAARLYEAKRAESVCKEHARNAEEARRRIEHELADAGLAPGKHRVGPLEISRTIVGPRESFDLRAARLGGFPVPDEYVRLVGAHERWRVERVSAEPLPAAVSADDFGDEAPF